MPALELNRRDVVQYVHTDDGDASALCPGTSPLAPVLTIQQAYDNLGPMFRLGQIRITGTEPADMPRWQAKLYHRLLFWGTDATFEADAKSSAITGTFAAGSTTSLLKFNASWTENQQRMRFWRITSGAVAETRGMVSSNAAHVGGVSDVIPAAQLGLGTPAAGDGWEIWDPGTALDVTAEYKRMLDLGFPGQDNYQMLAGVNHSRHGSDNFDPSCVALVNLTMRALPVTGWLEHSGPDIVDASVIFLGCKYSHELVGWGGVIASYNSWLALGTDDHASNNRACLARLAPFNEANELSWRGYGLVWDGSVGLTTGIAARGGRIGGYIVGKGSASGMRLEMRDGGDIDIGGGSIYEGQIISQGSGRVSRVGRWSGNCVFRFRNAVFTLPAMDAGGSSNVAVEAGGGSVTVTAVDFQTVGPCVSVRDNGVAVLPSADTTGSASGGVSLSATRGGRAIFTGGAPTLGTGSGDYELGGGVANVDRDNFSAANTIISGSGTIERTT